jgi:putative hemolysin
MTMYLTSNAIVQGHAAGAPMALHVGSRRCSMDIDTSTLMILALLGLLVLSAFFSSSETAFVSLQQIRIRHLENTGARGIHRVRRLFDRSEETLVTILIGNNLVNTGSAALATVLASEFLGAQAGALVATVVITIALLIFGEITPKTIAIRHGERMAQLYAPLLELFNLLFKPVAIIMTWIASSVASLAGAGNRDRALSQDEIRTVIMMGEEAGVLRQAETEILRNVLKLEQTEVSEIMMPRINVTGIQADETIADIAQTIAIRGFNQMPVYESDMDNIIGIVHAKEILLRAHGGDSASRARDVMRPAFFVPETKSIVSMLNEMRDQRTQMAVVIDEYGGTAGIVTLEDLIEEIVGEITSEYGTERRLIRSMSEAEAILDARISINDFNEAMDVELPSEDADTLGGFIFEQLRRIPDPGDSFQTNGMEFHVLSMSRQRISMVRVRRVEKPDHEDTNGPDSKEEVTDTT